MHSVDIQALLKKRGITQKEIAQKLGVSEMAVSKVINKTSVSDRIMRAIADGAGKDHRELFPEHYFGRRKKKRLNTLQGY